MISRQNALEKWPREDVMNTAQRVANFLKTFPTVEKLREFWEDTKNLTWPETYGSTPWEFAGSVAYHVFNEKGAHPIKLLAEKLKLYTTGDRQDHFLVSYYQDMMQTVRAIEVNMIVEGDQHGIFENAVFRTLRDGLQQGDVPVKLGDGSSLADVKYVAFTHRGLYFEPTPFFAVLCPTGSNLLSSDLLIFAGNYPDDTDAMPVKAYPMKKLLHGTTTAPDLRELARIFRYEESCGGYQWGVTRGPDGGYGAETLTQLVLMGYAGLTGNSVPNQLGGVWPEVSVTLPGIRAVIESGILLNMKEQPSGSIAQARGSWGEFEFDAKTGAVLGPMYGHGTTDPEFDYATAPIRIDLEELQNTYPDEEVAGMSYDILDLAYTTANGMHAEADQDWRDEFRQENQRMKM